MRFISKTFAAKEMKRIFEFKAKDYRENSCPVRVTSYPVCP